LDLRLGTPQVDKEILFIRYTHGDMEELNAGPTNTNPSS